MKVTVKQLIRDDSFQAERLLIDGKEVMGVCDLWECPEDAILGRGLNSMEEVADLMYLAYQAGKKGEVWDKETIECKEEEFDN